MVVFSAQILVFASAGTAALLSADSGAVIALPASGSCGLNGERATTSAPMWRLAASRPATTFDPDLYMFVDDHWIEHQRGVVRVAGRPLVSETPVVWPGDPAHERDCAWGNVIREPDGRWRMWYTTMMMGHAGQGAHEMARAGVWGRGKDFSFRPRSAADVHETECMLGKYAESADGIGWVKPALGLIEFRGNRDNNIILSGRRAAEQTGGALTNVDGFTVVRDDAETDPGKRYKMVAHWESVHFWDNSSASGSLNRPQAPMAKYAAARGKYITFSPDGLAWDQPLARLDVPNHGDRCLVVRDHRHDRWWLNNRPPNAYGAAGLQTSTNLIDWTPVQAVLLREEKSHPDIESMIPFNYGNQDLGFLITQVKRKDKLELLSFLVSHHEGEDWKRVARVPTEPFIAVGRPGSYHASGAVVLHNEPMIVGDELFIYFNAFSAAPASPCRYGSRSIGLARLRRDGFVGLAAADETGAVIVTQPLPVHGANLYLNIEQRPPAGSVHVSLLDERERPLPGYAEPDAVPIVGDSVRHRVRWQHKHDVSEWQRRSVRLRIATQGGAILYSAVFDE